MGVYGRLTVDSPKLAQPGESVRIFYIVGVTERFHSMLKVSHGEFGDRIDDWDGQAHKVSMSSKGFEEP